MEQQSYWVQTTDQQRLYVKTWGNANNPVVVLVHGHPDNQDVWEPVIQYLIHDYYIVTYDVRGAGMSSVPRRTRAYALPQLSLDLESVVNSVIHSVAFIWLRMTGVRFSHGSPRLSQNLESVCCHLPPFQAHA